MFISTWQCAEPLPQLCQFNVHLGRSNIRQFFVHTINPNPLEEFSSYFSQKCSVGEGMGGVAFELAYGQGHP
jgi:hypothetical protein